MPRNSDDQRQAQAHQSRAKNTDAREIGPPPPVTDPALRQSVTDSLRAFLVTVMPTVFYLDLSDDHETLIAKTEAVILRGGRIVVAMPRGSGKTSILFGAVLWATLCGHRRFSMLITADDTKFRKLLADMRTLLETNDTLLQLFPEVVHPIRSLERITLRCRGQTCDGTLTYIEFGGDRIVLPTTPYTIKAGNAGAVISGGGITGSAIRGATFLTPTGERLRPDLVLPDDPQTSASAKSESMTRERLEILAGDILGMAGPGRDIAALVSTTVIAVDDFADQLLDPEQAPGWQRIRAKTIVKWPDNMEAWDKYQDVCRAENNEELPAGSARKHYLGHRDTLDAGCEHYWPARVDPGFESAIHCSMDEYLRDPAAFMAEKQNEPTEQITNGVTQLSAKAIMTRTCAFERGVVPTDVELLTCHVDVQQDVLFWTVCGWTSVFGGYVVDFGCWPDQGRSLFTLRSVRRSYKHEGMDQAGATRAAVRDLVFTLGQKRWKAPSGTEHGIRVGLVDIGWAAVDVLYGLQSAKQNGWWGMHGTAVGANAQPMNKRRMNKPGRRGDNWILHKTSRNDVATVTADVNYFKTCTADSLRCNPDASQSMRLFSASKTLLEMFAQHCAAERGLRETGSAGTVDAWELTKQHLDNHFWDNLIGCRVAASIAGIRRDGRPAVAKRRRRGPRVRGLGL